jgi:hypothetical protein
MKKEKSKTETRSPEIKATESAKVKTKGSGSEKRDLVRYSTEE